MRKLFSPARIEQILNTMRQFIRLLTFWLLMISACAAEKPNIVFILADDLGINDLACYGRKEHHTPNLDRLASQGARFTQAYCAQPICSPSRAAILTGKSPARLHLTTFLPGRADAPSQKLLHPKIEKQLPLAEVTLAERLKEVGYATACIGKWHLGGTGFLPTDQGFDFYHAGQANTTPSETEGGKGERDLTRRAIDFITSNTNKPFFLYLAHNNPHIPYTARADRVEKNAKALEPVYAAVIEELDDSVGQLFSALDRLNLATNTLVIFTSDNGGLHVPELNHKVITHNTPFRAGKGYLYEGGLRVPLIVRWPGTIAAGSVINTPVIGTDWTPTLMRVADRMTPENDGLSILALLRGETIRTRPLYWHFPHYTNQGGQPGGAMRDGDWKLIENYEEGSLELYDLKNDIGETNNLASKESSRAMGMRDELHTWLINVDAQRNTANPAFVPRLREELYVDVVPSTYNAARTTPEEQRKILEWRQRMDVPPAKMPTQ
jgi:arylsulfatase A